MEDAPWMKMDVLLNMGTFQCHASFLGCNHPKSQHVQTVEEPNPYFRDLPADTLELVATKTVKNRRSMLYWAFSKCFIIVLGLPAENDSHGAAKSRMMQKADRTITQSPIFAALRAKLWQSSKSRGAALRIPSWIGQLSPSGKAPQKCHKNRPPGWAGHKWIVELNSWFFGTTHRPWLESALPTLALATTCFGLTWSEPARTQESLMYTRALWPATQTLTVLLNGSLATQPTMSRWK